MSMKKSWDEKPFTSNVYVNSAGAALNTALNITGRGEGEVCMFHQGGTGELRVTVDGTVVTNALLTNAEWASPLIFRYEWLKSFFVEYHANNVATAYCAVAYRNK